jgi:hypothetical protein
MRKDLTEEVRKAIEEEFRARKVYPTKNQFHIIPRERHRQRLSQKS